MLSHSKKFLTRALAFGFLTAFCASGVYSDDQDHLTKRPTTRPTRQKAIQNLEICSFNIQFLGSFGNRDNDALAELMQEEKCDIVVIQELVAAPDGDLFLTKNALYKFPFAESNGQRTYLYPKYGDKQDPIKTEKKSTRFFQAMYDAGFKDFILSPENTGTTSNHKNGTAAEWFVTFFKPEKVYPAEDIPHGFLGEDLVGKDRPFDRTPYAFPFRTKDGKADFVLISVHLHPSAGTKNTARRKEELNAIQAWITSQESESKERDFLVLGDMNIEDKEELADVLPKDWASLNAACVQTNTLEGGAKPYDHVWLNVNETREVPLEVKGTDGIMKPNFEVISLAQRMLKSWREAHPPVEDTPAAPYPGGDDPETPNVVEKYNHNPFRTTYSDHNPVKFKLFVPERDDD